MIGRKKSSRETIAPPRDTASLGDKDPAHGSAPAGGPQRPGEPRGAQAWSSPPSAEAEETDGGSGESSLITALLGLCRSKVQARGEGGPAWGGGAMQQF